MNKRLPFGTFQINTQKKTQNGQIYTACIFASTTPCSLIVLYANLCGAFDSQEHQPKQKPTLNRINTYGSIID